MAMIAHRLKRAKPKATTLPDWCDMVTHSSKPITVNAHRIASKKRLAKRSPSPAVVSLLNILSALVGFYACDVFVALSRLWF